MRLTEEEEYFSDSDVLWGTVGRASTVDTELWKAFMSDKTGQNEMDM
jgi:hypothetical protein